MNAKLESVVVAECNLQGTVVAVLSTTGKYPVDIAAACLLKV